MEMIKGRKNSRGCSSIVCHLHPLPVSLMLLCNLVFFSSLAKGIDTPLSAPAPAPPPINFTIPSSPSPSANTPLSAEGPTDSSMFFPSPSDIAEQNNPIYPVIVIFVVIMVVVLLVFVVFFKVRQESHPETMFRLATFLEDINYEKPVTFTSKQLRVYTNNYTTILGSGGFGKVYLGQLPNGVQCAVKVLQRNLDTKTEEQFKAEVITIGRTYHANLVRLYGFCYNSSLSALVYEYMKNGSLDKYLFQDNNNNNNQLAIGSWERLYEIALGTAKGMAYLHEECQHRIIHYDIKPANILLDDNFSPKVADFGLAKLCNMDQTHVTMTGYRGTPGYSAPEFLLHNFPISYKCDVYSFGMLLFEILGQRKNTKVGATSSLDWFPSFVWEKYEKGELEELITSSCGIEEAQRERAQRLANVALWCVQDCPQERPRMSAVVKMLDGGVEILPPPKPFSFMLSLRTTNMIHSSNSGSNSTSSQETNSNWYKDTTPIKLECEIQIEENI